MATFWALRAALWEDYSVTLLRISGFQKSVNVLLHTQIIPDVLLQDFAAVIAAAELQILKTGRTNPVTECKLSFSLSHEIKWSLLAQERDLLGGKFMFQRRCPLSATQNEQVRVSCVLQTLCGQKGEAKVLAERRITWAAKTKMKVSDWGCCVSPLEAVMWAWAQLLTLLLVVFFQMLFLRINASYKLHLKRQLAHLNVVNDGGPLNGWAGALLSFHWSN